MKLERRVFLGMVVLAMAGATPAFAGDDSDNSGSGGGSSGSGGEGGSGGGEGSGSGSSGSGGGGSSGSGGGEGGGSNSGSGGSSSGGSGGEGGSDDREDQKKARKAVKNGNAASLREVLRRVSARYKGDVVSAKLRGSGDKLTYRIVMVREDGRRITIDADAASKRILRVTGD